MDRVGDEFSELRKKEAEIEHARSYAFFYDDPSFVKPKRSILLTDKTDAFLLYALEKVVARMKKMRDETNADNLHSIRSNYNSIAAELNRRSNFAPAFRPRLYPIRPHFRCLIDDFHALDLQVLDMHWLHCRGRTPEEYSKTTAPIFTGTEIDFDAAWKFARKNWPMKKKVAALRLSPDEEWLLAIIHTSEIRSAHKALRAKAETLRRALRESSYTFPSRLREKLNRLS